MKKCTAILLLGILLFNTVGYRLYFHWQQQAADKNFIAQLDAGAYNDKDLVQVSIPLSLPYITDTKDFERVDGSVTYNGNIYKYVKRKVSNGNLVILCLKDEKATELSQSKKLYQSVVSNSAESADKKSPQKSNLKNILVEFLPQARWQLTARMSDRQIFVLANNYFSSLLQAPPQLQPPELNLVFLS